MFEVVLATGNPHKVLEMGEIFRPSNLSVIGLADLDGPFNEPDETGSTFRENATIKAVSYAAQTGRWCLADDSGLEVDALHGAPGVISSHYCTDGEDRGMHRTERDAANNERLLHDLRGVEPEARTARFVCEMVLATPDGDVAAHARGTFEGSIGVAPDVPRGDNGFGYDPLFLLPPPDPRTSAELSSDEKNARSHRGAASRGMLEEIQRLGLIRGA